MVQRGTQHLTEKRRIAERALELIEDGDTIREATDTVRVLFMGGLVRRNHHCTVIHGSASRDILAGLSVDKAFEGGEHAEKLMMSIAAKVILLFDASKMGRTSFALFAPLEAIDAIITDAIGAEDRARLVENGIDALVAG